MAAAKTLQEMFKAECINVSAFARKNSVSYPALVSLVYGRTEPDRTQVRTFKCIADGFGMTMDELYSVLVPEDSD